MSEYEPGLDKGIVEPIAVPFIAVIGVLPRGCDDIDKMGWRVYMYAKDGRRMELEKDDYSQQMAHERAEIWEDFSGLKIRQFTEETITKAVLTEQYQST